MNTITAIFKPDADGTVHLPLPEAWRNRRIRVKAELEPVGGGDAAPPALKGFGCLAGKISLSPDFDEPLDDFKDYTA
ncbi:DUF2281 domain-containing protein [Luteolibacter yonseiensis]|uniref:DUF2281 domain-containing protein n=1 Tax=Luteolibacter yonseiensis TaxID=1144680 RepID=A0A934R5F0_9BACT|nr:DUF2281 domain-containing protein [Luteolibacter yonseiensis]MBK1815790.1 DUF2281 domain-containing protein [Luteolibacter yonseiensis]